MTEFKFKPFKRVGEKNFIVFKGDRKDLAYLYFDGQEDQALEAIKKYINAGKVAKLGDNKIVTINDEALLLPADCPSGLSKEQKINRLRPAVVAQVDTLDDNGEIIVNQSQFFTKSLKPIDSCRLLR